MKILRSGRNMVRLTNVHCPSKPSAPSFDFVFVQLLVLSSSGFLASLTFDLPKAILKERTIDLEKLKPLPSFKC